MTSSFLSIFGLALLRAQPLSPGIAKEQPVRAIAFKNSLLSISRPLIQFQLALFERSFESFGAILAL
jgi:hypothetical protein